MVFCENPKKTGFGENDGRKKFGSQVDETSSYSSYTGNLTMIEEVVTLRIDSVWDFTEKKIEEYESIDRNFVVRKDFYKMLYSINNQPVCTSNFRFIDDRNIVIQDYTYGESTMIGPMFKEFLKETRKKYPDMNIYILIDENGNGKPNEALRKDKILLYIKDTYYPVEIGRNPLFNSDEPIGIFLDNRIRTLWAFDQNMKDTMESFIEVQREQIRGIQLAKRNAVFENTEHQDSTCLTPPIQRMSLPEPSLTADEKETPRIKMKSRKEVENGDKRVVQFDKNAKESSIAQPKRKRGRPPGK